MAYIIYASMWTFLHNHPPTCNLLNNTLAEISGGTILHSFSSHLTIYTHTKTLLSCTFLSKGKNTINFFLSFFPSLSLHTVFCLFILMRWNLKPVTLLIVCCNNEAYDMVASFDLSAPFFFYCPLTVTYYNFPERRKNEFLSFFFFFLHCGRWQNDELFILCYCLDPRIQACVLLSSNYRKGVFPEAIYLLWNFCSSYQYQHILSCLHLLLCLR